MPRRTTFVTLAVVVLALAGCGSTKNASTTAATGSTPPASVSTPSEAHPPVTSATYVVNLAGFAGGSPNGSGLAVISINPSRGELCWKFSRLKNVTAPTVARIYRNWVGATGRGGSTGRGGYLLGRAYESSGCVPEESVVLGLIEAKPQVFYVNIHTARFRNGAVRGPL
jgi:hypothetical protein